MKFDLMMVLHQDIVSVHPNNNMNAVLWKSTSRCFVKHVSIMLKKL